MTHSRFLALALLLAASLAFPACKDDDDPKPQPPANEGEVITTLRYTLTPVGGGAARTAQFRDLDGDGGTAPVLTYDGGAARLLLDKTKTYTGAVLLLDETKSPVDTISNEVLEEADEHLFVYKLSAPTPADLLTITRTDRDANMLPLGLETTVAPRATPGTGTLQIILKHQPGVKDGTEAPGDTDIDVSFGVEVR